MKKLKKWVIFGIPILIILSIFTMKDVKVVEKCNIPFNEKEAKYEIGDTVLIGNLRYEIERLYTADILSNENLGNTGPKNSSLVNSVKANKLFDFVGEDNHFLIVKLKVTNISPENNYRIFPSMFKLVNDEQIMNPLDQEAITCFKDYYGFFKGEIGSGKSQTGYVAFLMQDFQDHYALKISGGEFSILEELVYFKDEEILKYNDY